MPLTDTLTPADLKHIGNLPLLARTVVEGLNTGVHRSPDKGASVEFKQHRPYVPGDDLRNLDWKVFAKSDRFYIREYEEETNLRATILLDHSGSMRYRSQSGVFGDAAGMSKHDYAVRLAACLSYLIISQGDAAGMMTFDTQVTGYIPPRGKPGHVGILLDAMTRLAPGGETDLGKVLRDASPKIKRRGMVILISDCFGDVSQTLRGLANFGRSAHDIMIFQVWDRDELDFPFKRWHRFDSLEDPNDRHLLDPAQLRKAYLEKLDAFRKQLLAGCRKRRVDLVPIVTDQPYAEALAAYLAHRQYRSKGASGGGKR
ncbi:DUF58 domain-containing protein [Phycisphaeraceae bacterium D3-23]